MEEIPKPKTYRREWLKEAYLIFRGDTKIKPKKEHVAAAIQSLIHIQEETKKLRDVLKLAYDEACKKRAAQGLPNPPMPPTLAKEMHK